MKFFKEYRIIIKNIYNNIKIKNKEKAIERNREFFRSVSRDILDKVLSNTDLTKGITPLKNEILEEIRKYSREKFGSYNGNYNKRHYKYWIQRGFSEKCSYYLSKKRKLENPIHVKSPFDYKTWMEKGYSEEEAKYKANSIRPIKKEYWLERGYSEEEAIEKAKEVKNKNNNNGKKKKYPFESNTLEYWTMRGYSKKEAVEKVKERQSTFSLEKCIQKHGEEEGRKVFEERQRKWQETLNNKTQEEIIDINKRKMTKNTNFYSKESIEFFQPIYNFLIFNNFEEKDVYWKDYEFPLIDSTDNKVSFYDFTIPKLKLIIEYHGSAWHYNPNYNYKEDFRSPFHNKTLEEMKQKDEQKRKLAIKNGFDITEVFDTDDKEERQKEIIERIKGMLWKLQ
jgi:hypothetical protein